MAVSLAGKTAIITGAGSGNFEPIQSSLYLSIYSYLADVSEGINYHFARALLAQKCNVVLADLALRPEAEELVAKHQSASRATAQAVFQRTDVRTWAHLEEMFRTADKEFGGADVVCPGAGVYEPVCWPTTAVSSPSSCVFCRYYMDVVFNRAAKAMEETISPEYRSQLEVPLQHSHGNP